MQKSSKLSKKKAINSQHSTATSKMNEFKKIKIKIILKMHFQDLNASK